MGGLFKTPSIPKPPPLPETPRLPVETDPDLKKRADMRATAQRKGRLSTIMAGKGDKTAAEITKASLGGGTGHDYSGVGPKPK